MGLALYSLGCILAFGGWIWLIVVAFTEGGLLWGLGTLFFPIIGLIFAIKYWDEAKNPFLVKIAGFILMIVSAIVFSLLGWFLYGVAAKSRRK